MFTLLLTMLVCGQCAGMVLELHSAKTEYLLDEPLVLVLELRNDSGKVVEFTSFFEYSFEAADLYVTRPGGKTILMNPWPHLDFALPQSGKLFAPRESITRSVMILYPAQCDSFARIGAVSLYATYELSAKLKGGPISLRSNELNLLIKQPEGEEQQAHAVLFGDPSIKVWEYSGDMVKRNTQNARFIELTRQYPNSIYTPMAQYRYASDLASRLGHIVPANGSQERKELGEHALEQCRILVKLTKDTPFETHGLLEYARALARCREPEQAFSILEMALLCPTATTDERRQALSWIHLTEKGNLRENLITEGETYPLPEHFLPLVPTIKAFGFRITYDEQTKTARIENGYMTAILPVGSDTVTVNGKKQEGARSRIDADGQIRVTLKTLGYILSLQFLTQDN